MKHLKLTEAEVKDLRSQTRKKFIYYLSTSLGLLILSFSLMAIVKPVQLVRLSISDILLTFFVLLTGIVGVIYLWLHRSMSLQSTKKVYTGAVSEKRIKETQKESKYYLYMDGNKFRVTEEEYNAFEIGAPIEFHVSVKDKHLLKVTKPEASMAIA